jgi:hypothetical protein
MVVTARVKRLDGSPFKLYLDLLLTGIVRDYFAVVPGTIFYLIIVIVLIVDLLARVVIIINYLFIAAYKVKVKVKITFNLILN